MEYRSACTALLERVVKKGRKPALISEYAPICYMRLITQEYGMCVKRDKSEGNYYLCSQIHSHFRERRQMQMLIMQLWNQG